MVDIFFLALDLIVGVIIAWFSIYVLYRLVHEDR